MKKSRIYVLFIAAVSFSCLTLTGCGKENNTVIEEKIEISSGSVLIEENGEYKNYNLEDEKYSKLDTDKTIIEYDKDSGKYIYNSNGEKYLYNNKESIKINEKNPIKLQISPNGKFITYFKNEGYLQLVIIDAETGEELEFDSMVAISGDLIDWIGEEQLVYYGIDDDKNNGLFTYNIKTNKEELLYKLDVGYIEFLETSRHGTVFVQETVNSEKILKLIDSNKDVTELTNEIVEVSDIEITDKGVYLLGKLKDDNYSVYKIDNGIKRLIFDFPSIIHLDKGLSSDDEGNILFIGSIDSFNNENIYKYADESITAITDTDFKYNFVKIK
ncbi:hypothetical protein [Clostridium sp.]|uniref:hypothetical protein n=1 Tax=Clostridium sp. TaxID=1506 RepID=UPI003F3FDA33